MVVCTHCTCSAPMIPISDLRKWVSNLGYWKEKGHKGGTGTRSQKNMTFKTTSDQGSPDHRDSTQAMRPSAPEGIFHVHRRLHITLHASEEETAAAIEANPRHFYFSSNAAKTYAPYCGDFGPVIMPIVVEFCEHVATKMDHPLLQEREMIFYMDKTSEKNATNNVFLLCAYLVVKVGLSPDEAVACFESIEHLPVIPFHDATYTTQTYLLSVHDVLAGMVKAMNVNFYDYETFNTERFLQIYNAETYNLSCITPKFAAFAGPTANPDGAVPFPIEPSRYISIFRSMGVSDIVRLNERDSYDSAVFEEQGFRFHDLEFTDCTCPSPEIIERFLDTVDAAEGVVAVHCLAGLGRTGTLIACHMIKNHDFSAGEAIGYLRLMRPGSVIATQQNFLELIVDAKWEGNLPVCAEEYAEKANTLAVDRPHQGTSPSRNQETGSTDVFDQLHTDNVAAFSELPSPPGFCGGKDVSTHSIRISRDKRVPVSEQELHQLAQGAGAKAIAKMVSDSLGKKHAL